jgi:antitoxin component YwqK of YwqJK toxin-antitoxin module
VSFYENGQLKERWQYENNKKTWERIEYFDDGTTKSKWSYKNGEMDGHWVWYCKKWDDKCLEWEWDYKDWREVYGVEQYGNFNTYSFFWPTKQVESAVFEDNDWIFNWDYISFYENGQIKERGQYKNDKKIWDWIEYFENGEIKWEWTYKNGEKIN